MNSYSFLRQLTLPLSSAEGKKLFTLLQLENIEIYEQLPGGENFQLLTDVTDTSEMIFYVSAADREAAVQIMQNSGLASYINISTVAAVEADKEDYISQAKDEYYRKHKATLYECLIVILAALLLFLIRRG